MLLTCATRGNQSLTWWHTCGDNHPGTDHSAQEDDILHQVPIFNRGTVEMNFVQ